MSKTASAVRKIAVALIGIPILVLGIILIPLPGPGLLISLLGLIILSTEFDWAKGPADKAKAAVKSLIDKAKASQK